MRFFKVIDYGVYRIYHEEAGKRPEEMLPLEPDYEGCGMTKLVLSIG